MTTETDKSDCLSLQRWLAVLTAKVTLGGLGWSSAALVLQLSGAVSVALLQRRQQLVHKRTNSWHTCNRVVVTERGEVVCCMDRPDPTCLIQAEPITDRRAGSKFHPLS